MARSFKDDDSNSEIEAITDPEVDEVEVAENINLVLDLTNDPSAGPSTGRQSEKARSSFERSGSILPRDLGQSLFPDDEDEVHSLMPRLERGNGRAVESDSENMGVDQEDEEQEEDAISMVSVGSFVGSISATPSSPPKSYKGKGRMLVERLDLCVEIPLKPLEELDDYVVFPSDIEGPTETSRSLLPTMTDNEEEVPDSESSRSPSIIAVRPKRTTQNKIPSWKVASSLEFSEDELRLGTDDVDIESDGAYGEDELSENTGDSSQEEDSQEEDELMRRTRSKRRHHHSSRRPQHSKRKRQERSSRPSSSHRSSYYNRRHNMRSIKKSTRRNHERVEDDEDDQGSEQELGTPSEGEDELEEEDELFSEYSERSSDVAEHSGDIVARHREFCEKCKREPAVEMLARAEKRKKSSGRKRKLDDDEIQDEELAKMLQGWLECKKCVVSSHWDCLGQNQKQSVLFDLADIEGPPPPGQKARKVVGIDEEAKFLCARCTASPICFVCRREQPVDRGRDGSTVLEMNGKRDKPPDDDGDIRMEDGNDADKKDIPNGVNTSEDVDGTASLLFRCTRCKQACHYEHMTDPFDVEEQHDLDDIADHYQRPTGKRHDNWQCHQCREWIWNVDIICAWRPNPPNAKEDVREPGEKPSFKDPLPREYLVKWVGRGFRHVTWVPHPWMQTGAPAKLRNFLEKGPQLDLVTDETLAARGDEMANPTIANVLDVEGGVTQGHSRHDHTKNEWEGHGPAPDSNAAFSIPQEWRTVDRVLDVCLVPPKLQKKVAKRKRNRLLSASITPSVADSVPPSPTHNRPDGIEPLDEEKMDIDEWEKKAGRILTEDDLDEVAPLVTWCYVKWDDLQYDQSCWDTPPPVNSTLYPAFERALSRYLRARQVTIPVLTSSQIKQREADAARQRQPPQAQPDCVIGGKLMDFQMQGFQWLLFKYFKRESCILADDMGLGKTIQIASLLGYLGSDELELYPCLVVVPNSTITNWVREFEKWVPHMRVVPYYGEKASRKVISKYELYHKGLENKASGLKAHIILTTYDTITSADFRVFSNVPRWEVLCVDEGQRLKSDSNLIFGRLKSLNSVHRILLTGTPLNNNLRELFNLLNFLDSDTFRHLEDLEARFVDLNEGLIQELHNMIRPYILRRIKADVLKLPPKVEIIVPISLTPLQKNVYKSILERNADVLKAIAEARRKKAKKANASNLIGGGETIANKLTVNGTSAAYNAEGGQLKDVRIADGQAGPSTAVNRESQATLIA